VTATITKHDSNHRTALLSDYPKTSEVTTRLCADQFAEALNNLRISDSNQGLTAKQLFIKLSYLTVLLIIILE